MNSQGKSVNKDSRYDAQRLRSKRIVIISLIVSIVFIGAYFVINAIINYDSGEKPPVQPIFFYEADWQKDIMKDPKYLELDRDIYYEDIRRNEKTTLTDENVASVSQDYKVGVNLLRKYVRYVIKGNHKAINMMFSDAYYAAGYESKEAFTMQQLYDICITNCQLSMITENGQTHQRYELWLEYKIRENNGTFRNDMGSDGKKPEYFIITDRNGDVKIDAIMQIN